MHRHHEFPHFLRRLPDDGRRSRLYHYPARRRRQLPRRSMLGSLLSTRVAPLSCRRPLPPRTRRLKPRAVSRSILHTWRKAETAANEKEADPLSALPSSSVALDSFPPPITVASTFSSRSSSVASPRDLKYTSTAASPGMCKYPLCMLSAIRFRTLSTLIRSGLAIYSHLQRAGVDSPADHAYCRWLVTFRAVLSHRVFETPLRDGMIVAGFFLLGIIVFRCFRRQLLCYRQCHPLCARTGPAKLALVAKASEGSSVDGYFSVVTLTKFLLQPRMRPSLHLWYWVVVFALVTSPVAASVSDRGGNISQAMIANAGAQLASANSLPETAPFIPTYSIEYGDEFSTTEGRAVVPEHTMEKRSRNGGKPDQLCLKLDETACPIPGSK